MISFALALALAQLFGNPAPPNLLVIQTDEHNFRTLGCYREHLPREQGRMWGEVVVETPHIDRIGREGAIALRYYASTPVCSPSRASFLTGRYPHRTDVVKNDIPLRDGLPTVASILSERGYATGYAGKWHLDGTAKPGFAPERGFGFDDRRFMFNRGHWKKLVLEDGRPRVGATNKRGAPSYGLAGADEATYTTDFLTDRAIEFVRANRSRPFFFMLSYPDPHGPDRVRPPYDRMFANREFEAPRTFEVDADALPSWARPQKGGVDQSQYFGMVKCIDDNVGRLLAALDEFGIAGRTMVVFTSDHGDLRGEHHRQNKGVPFEASARIPFLLRLPGVVPSRTVVREALSTIDFLPTALSLLGAALPDGSDVDGADASDLFRGDEPGSFTDRVAILRGAGGPAGGWLCAVTRRFKLVVSEGDDPWLFDLERDPDELRNYCDDPAALDDRVRLARELLRYGEDSRDKRVAVPEIEETLERLARPR